MAVAVCPFGEGRRQAFPLQTHLRALLAGKRRSIVLAIGVNDSTRGEIAVFVWDGFQIGDDASGFRSCRIFQRLSDDTQRQVLALCSQLAFDLVDFRRGQFLDRIRETRGKVQIRFVLLARQRQGTRGSIDRFEEGVEHLLLGGNQQQIELAGDCRIQVGGLDSPDRYDD